MKWRSTQLRVIGQGENHVHSSALPRGVRAALCPTPDELIKHHSVGFLCSFFKNYFLKLKYNDITSPFPFFSPAFPRYAPLALSNSWSPFLCACVVVGGGGSVGGGGDGGF